MLPKWQEVIEDDTERAVFTSLADPRWDFRTVDGIARETGLPGPDVQKVIDRHLGSGLIRESRTIGRPGQRLFTLGQNRVRIEEALRFLRQTMSKSIE